MWQQTGLIFQGRFAEAKAVYEELMPLVESNEDLTGLFLSSMVMAYLHQAEVDLGKSSLETSRSADVCQAAGLPWHHMIRAHGAANAILTGDEDRAREIFEAGGANPLPGTVHSLGDLGYWLNGKAQLGDPDAYDGLLERIDELRVRETPADSG